MKFQCMEATAQFTQKFSMGTPFPQNLILFRAPKGGYFDQGLFSSAKSKGTAGRGRQKTCHDNLRQRHNNLQHFTTSVLPKSARSTLETPHKTCHNPPESLSE